MKVRNYFFKLVTIKVLLSSVSFKIEAGLQFTEHQKYCSKLPKNLNAEVFIARQNLITPIWNSSTFKQ